MAWAGLVMSAVGAVASANAQQQQAKAQAEAADFNAAIAQREAQQQKELIYSQSREKLSQIQASRAKGGVSGEGTPLLVMAESAANAEADVIAVQQTANIESYMYRKEADNYTKAGKTAAGSALLSGASSFF